MFVKGGRPAIMGKPGSVTPEHLVLDGAQLHYGHIVETETRERRIVLLLDHVDRVDPRIAGQIEDAALVLEIRSRAPRDVEIAIDRIASRYAAERAYQALCAQGRGQEFRTLPCPHCGATVDRSTLPATPYVYCRFCSSPFQQGQPPTGAPSAYRTCDDCGMFDRVQGYTEFYFYIRLLRRICG